MSNQLRKSRQSNPRLALFPRLALLPGFALCIAGAASAFALHSMVPAISALPAAIVFGAVIGNLLRADSVAVRGVGSCTRRPLRIGVALLGLQLSAGEVLSIGWPMILTAVVVVPVGIVGTLALGAVLQIGFGQRMLVACGFSICGAAAIGALDQVVPPRREETLAAIALVVLFGTAMIPAIPLLATGLGLPDSAAAAWAGASVHEVGQVVAIGETLGGSALGIAVAVKLIRVLMLAPVVVVVGRFARVGQGEGADTGRPPIIPLFIVGFIACVAVRSTNILPGGVLAAGETTGTALLAIAMFALGTGIRSEVLRRLDLRMIALGTGSTLLVAAVALGGILMASP